jgi:dephospho-CoA kinase
VGKSEVARILAERYGFQICNTGRLCREMSAIVFGDESKAHMQEITDALRTIDPSIFLKAALRSVDTDSRLVIDSVRFFSDVELIKAGGLSLIRVRASNEARHARLQTRGQIFTATQDLHISESEADSFNVDGTVTNTGSLCDLEAQIAALIAEA